MRSTLVEGIVMLAVASLAFGATGCGKFTTAGQEDAGSEFGHGVGEACETQQNCRAGLLCVANSCQPTGTGAPGSICTLTADCASELYCGPSRTCEPAGDGEDGDRCSSNADCQHGLVCALEGFASFCRESGTADLNDACVSPTDCYAGLTCTHFSSGTTCVSAPALELDDGEVLPPVVPYWSGVECDDDATVAKAYFEVPRDGARAGDFYRLPFPNDIRSNGATLDLADHPSPTTVLPDNVIERVLRASEEELDGFSTNPVIFFRFNKPYDGSNAGEALRIVDITPESPTYGVDSGISWLTTSGSVSRYMCPNWLAVKPPTGAPLRPATTYAALVTTAIEPAAEADGSFSRPDDLVALLSDETPTDSALAQAHESYAPLRAFLAKEKIDTSTILNATVFTTQDPENVVEKLRDAVDAATLPTVRDLTLCDGANDSPCDDGTTERACSAPVSGMVEIHGRIDLPIFQEGDAPYLHLEDGGSFSLDSNGQPVVTRTESVCFALTIPETPMPESGYPLLFFAHGTGGSFTEPVRSGLALRAAVADSAPSATLAIDLPQHGARRGESTDSPDLLFFNFSNPRAARGNILQGVADLMSVLRFAAEGEIAADVSPSGSVVRFDDSRLVLFAHSQGATHASIALPYEPRLSAAVLSGNGGDLVQSLLTKTEPFDIQAIVPYALLDADVNGELTAGKHHPVLALFQQYFDAVDPVNYAWRLSRQPVEGSTGAHVFMTYGLMDSYSTKETMSAYAKAASLIMVTPVLDEINLTTADPPLRENRTVNGTSRTIGIRQYQPAEGEDGHFVAFDESAGAPDVERFLLEALGGNVPSIGAEP